MPAPRRWCPGPRTPPICRKILSVDSLGGTRVLFDGVAAPMVYAQRGQICAIVPFELTGRKTTEVVVEYEGRQSTPVELPVVSSAPAIFTLDASGAGRAAMLNETGAAIRSGIRRCAARWPRLMPPARGCLLYGRVEGAGDSARATGDGRRRTGADCVVGKCWCAAGELSDTCGRSRGRRGPAGAHGGRRAEFPVRDDGGPFGEAAGSVSHQRRCGTVAAISWHSHRRGL